MCGITGAVWTPGGEPLPREVLAQMMAVLAHRGPDGSGDYWQREDDGSGVALGHRRLAIIDLAGGKQPLSNEDGSVWITLNGEIYNYRELRTQLEAAGHQFRTHSDTETIVHLYEEKGVDCLKDLRGMFAFAIWDRRRRRLFMARDRLGQKPLVYRQERERLLFASEIKSLLQVPGIPREVDPVALNEYLTYLYVPHPRTMIDGIRKLPPGHYAIYEEGRLTIDRYWHPDFNAQSSLGVQELGEKLDAELQESVRLRLRSDVPLGAFLSGGIDSTVIVGLMQRHAARATKTYTIGFPVDGFDESSVARDTAAHLKTEHHEFQVQPDSVGILPLLAWYFDEPFGDSSAIPTYYVSQITRQHVKVALTGDGGDELFGGYPRYQTVERVGMFDRLPGPVRSLIANPLWQWAPAPNRQDSFLRKLQFRMSLLREPADRRYVNWVSIFHSGLRQALYSDDFAARLGTDHAADFFADAIAQCSQRSWGSRAMIADLLSYLPCDLLVKVDIASMAHGLECRSPFLDHRVVELATAIPYHHKIQKTGGKYILKNTFSDLMIDDVKSRRKTGFRIPLSHWFRHELKDFLRDQLLDRTSLERGYFRPQQVRQLIDEHNSGQWDHADRLWTLLCLELWHQTFIDPATPPTCAPTSLTTVPA